MKSNQRTLLSFLDDGGCQVMAHNKFEIRTLEAYCHWVICKAPCLTEEYLVQLKSIYTVLAEYYERLLQFELSKYSVKSSSSELSDFLASSHQYQLPGKHGQSEDNLLAVFRLIEETGREMILAYTYSAQVSFIIRMGELCRWFVCLLEEKLKFNETPELIEGGVDLFGSENNENVDLTSTKNETLESLFRALE